MRKDYFTTSEMKSIIAELPTYKATGQDCTVHGNHSDCGDTKHRLYVTKRDDNRYLFFCHNCGKRGSYGISADGYSIRDNGHVSTSTRNTLSFNCSDIKDSYVRGALINMLEKHIPVGYLDYPVAYALYRWSGGKCFAGTHRENAEFAPFAITWGTGPTSTDHEHILETGEARFAGAQNWVIENSKWKKMSYSTMSPALFYDTENGPTDKLLVIVEDPISALCVTMLSHGKADALCLFGVNCQAMALSEYAALYDTVLVWLDGDSPDNHVRMHNMVRTLSLFSNKVASGATYFNDAHRRYKIQAKNINYMKDDLKNYKHEYIRDIINSYISDF